MSKNVKNTPSIHIEQCCQTAFDEYDDFEIYKTMAVDRNVLKSDFRIQETHFTDQSRNHGLRVMSDSSGPETNYDSIWNNLSIRDNTPTATRAPQLVLPAIKLPSVRARCIS